MPRTRFFLSGFLRKLVPIGIIGTLIRIFWTVPQEFPERRREIFKRADRILRETGDSVYLSPEGMRVTTGEIGAFGEGAVPFRREPTSDREHDCVPEISAVKLPSALANQITFKIGQ